MKIPQLLTLLLFSQIAFAVEPSDSFELLRNLALEKSPSIQIANDQYQSKKFREYSAFARWLPRLDLSLSANRDKNSALNQLSFFTKSKEDYQAWQLSLNFPIFKRSIQNQFVLSIHEKRLYKTKYEAATMQFNYQFANALGEFLYQKYKTAVIVNSLQLAQTNLNEVTLSFQLKKKNKINSLIWAHL